MSVHRYPPGALRADYARATFGLILCAGPIMLAQPIAAIRYILGGIAVLFALFGLRTLLRQLTRTELTDQAIRTVGPFGACVSWDDLTAVELRYYSTRRDRDKGWMQLKLTAGGRRIVFDSAISDFELLARRAFAEAERRGCTIAPASFDNLHALAAGPAPARHGTR